MLTHSGFAYYQSGPQTACLFQTRPLPLEVHILIHLCLSTSGEHRESLHFYEFFQEPGHWHKGFSFFPSFLESLSYWRWCGIFSPFLSPDHVCLSSFFLPVSQCSSSCQFASPCAGFFFFFWRLLLHSAFQAMSATTAVRIKATTFSRSVMNCCCLTGAASETRRETERVENKPINHQLRLICVNLRQPWSAAVVL